MRISVKTREAKNIKIHTQPTCIISQIKNKIKKRLNIPVENQHLIFEGLTLNDERTIDSYDLQDGTEILLANKDQPLLLKQSNLPNNTKLIDHINQANKEISSADERSTIFLLNEAISFLDDNLDQQTVKSLFSLIQSCFEKFTDQSFKILDSRLQKEIVNSYHLILVTQILSYFVQTRKNKPTRDYDDFISKSLQDILDKKPTILQYHIPSQFEDDFKTDIIILSEITDKIVTDFSKLFFTGKISFNKLNFFVDEVSKKNLIKSIPESIFIEKNQFLEFSLDIIIDFIDRSTAETFKKISKPIEDSFAKKNQITNKFSNAFLSKCIKLGIKPGKIDDLLKNFEKIEDTSFWEYIYKNKITIPKEAVEKFPYVDKLISIILKIPNLEDNSGLFEMFYKILMTKTYISTNYILIHLEKITEGIRLYPKLIFEHLNDLYKQYSEEFDETINNNYTFSKSNKVFIRKIKPQNSIEKTDIPFIKKLMQKKSFESFLLLQNIACSFPFLFDFSAIEVIENIKPALSCFELFFKPQINEYEMNKLKIAASALAFLSACLYSTNFLSFFIDWIFDNLSKLNPSQFIFMSFILYSLFETKVINKTTLAMAIKYKFFQIVHSLLKEDKIPEGPYESYYKKRIYELSLKYIELYMSFWDNDSYLFIDQIIKDCIKEPIKIEFNNFTIISNVIFQPLKISFQHENDHINKIMALFEKIGTIRYYWVLYNTSSTNKPMDVTINNFLSKFKDGSFNKNPDFKLPKVRTLKMQRYLQTEPKWVLGFINYYDPNVGILDEYYEYLKKIYDKIDKTRKRQNNNDNHDEEEEEEEEYNDYDVKVEDEHIKLYDHKRIYLYDRFYKRICPEIFYEELLIDIRILPQVEHYIYEIIRKITQNKICAKDFLNEIYQSIPNTCEYLIKSEFLLNRMIYFLRTNKILMDEKLIQDFNSHLLYLNENKKLLKDLVKSYEEYINDIKSKKPPNPALILSAFDHMPRYDRYQSDYSKDIIIDFAEPISIVFSKDPNDNKWLLHASKQLQKKSLHWKFLYEDHRGFLISMIQKNEKNEKFIDSLPFIKDYFELMPFRNRLNNFKKKILKTNKAPKTLTISRENIFNDSVHGLLKFEPADFLGSIIVKFKDSKGLNENLYKEWFEYVIKCIFDNNKNFFAKTKEETYYPNPNYKIDDIYKFAARLVVLALIHGQHLSVHLSKVFLRQILHQKINFYDLKEFDKSVYDDLKNILDSDNVESLDKFYLVNGIRTKVTNENKINLVSMFTYNILRKQMDKQIDAFSQAFDSIILPEYIKMFTPKEFDSIIYGKEKIDVESFKEHVQYKNKITEKDPTIQIFFKVISKWKQNYLSKLIRFITGSTHMPIDGFRDFEDKGCPITINLIEKSKDPTSQTYNNTLDLPKYDTEEEMNEKLMAAVDNYINPFEKL